MSESEGKKELAGLARSVDALWGGPAKDTDAPPEAAPESESEIGSESGMETESEIAAEPEPEIEFVADSKAVVAEPVFDVEPALAVEDGPSTTPPNLGQDEDEEPVTPLDLAVDAYLAGDREQAVEIKRLSDELLERKEVEPIARSVARLVLAAGTPPDATVYGVAESIMSPVVLGRLSRRIGSERDEGRRSEYFSVCTTIGEDMAVAIRNDLAESTDRLSRRIHYDALVAMGGASRSVIEQMAVDDNRFLVRNAVSMLGDLGGDNAVDLVTSALANPDARVRREALLSLAKLGDVDAGQLVPGLLDDSEPEVRRAAVIATGELRVERALRQLIAMLEDTTDPDEVLPLVRALGQLGDAGAVASIEKHAVRSLFSKPRTDVRIASYRALAAIGTPHARRLLNQAVSDKDPEVKAAVKEMLHLR